MAETSGFWTTSGAGTGDQVASYTQAHHSTALILAAGARSQDGVSTGYLNGLAVTAGAAKVSVASGGALVDGKWYTNSASFDIAIPTPTTGTSRIDRIVARATWSGFIVRAVRIAGTESSSPSAPALTQTRGSVYEIPLAQVHVTSAGVITITDERYPAESSRTMPIIAVGEIETLVASSSIPVRQVIIPEQWQGAQLTGITGGLFTVSSSGAVAVRIYNATQSFNLLNANLSIPASTRTATSTSINSAAATLVKGDLMQIFVESAGTGAKGLQLDIIALARG